MDISRRIRMAIGADDLNFTDDFKKEIFLKRDFSKIAIVKKI